MKTTAYAASILKLFFQAVAISKIADNAGTTPLTNLYLSLHTADPGVAGTQTTSEAAYTSYARVAVLRTSGGFDFSGTTITLHALTSFPAATGGSESETHFGIGSDSTGTGNLYYSGPIGSNLGTFTALASNDTLTIPAVSGVSVGDKISFYAITGGSLPTGITTGVVYFVKTISGTAVTISTTNGGTTLDITADGSGIAFREAPITVVNGVTPQLTTSTSIIEA